jgi:AcrR family transcriptional regulator
MKEVNRVRLTASQRRTVILNAALRVANEDGLVNLSYAKVAKRCEVATKVSTIRYHYPQKITLWQAVMECDGLSDHVHETAREIGLSN